MIIPISEDFFIKEVLTHQRYPAMAAVCNGRKLTGETAKAVKRAQSYFCFQECIISTSRVYVSESQRFF
ncbi:hypothetical protein OUZ56_012450 [Daphnia magna]|uniref:Uncharacterized protein n=1 Tax=Daphnia magna TaxID=35525 RepID=A0ABQ9Z319_9CRUS|nr:hypothetical protein OUZ56_012450 [Daphnia magna]